MMETKKMVTRLFMAVVMAVMVALPMTSEASPRFHGGDEPQTETVSTRRVEEVATAQDESRIQKSTAGEEVIATIPASGSRIESAGANGEEVIATIDVSKPQDIFMIDRANGKIVKMKVDSASGYSEILADKAEDGAILVFEGQRAKASFEKAARELQESVTRKKVGHFKVLRETNVNALDSNERAVLAQHIPTPEHVNVIEVMDQYHDARPVDGRSDLEKGLSMINDAVGAWNAIESIRHW